MNMCLPENSSRFVWLKASAKAIRLSNAQWRLMVMFALTFTVPAANAACPKLLMFDGSDIRTQTTVSQAEYWGKDVGVQGFFVNRIMPDWQTNVDFFQQGSHTL